MLAIFEMGSPSFHRQFFEGDEVALIATTLTAQNVAMYWRHARPHWFIRHLPWLCDAESGKILGTPRPESQTFPDGARCRLRVLDGGVSGTRDRLGSGIFG
jgi:hypothetical protein